MNKYALAAVEAANLCIRNTKLRPIDAWEKAITRFYDAKSPARKKSCPRNAFLGLCGAGLVKGIAPGEYTDSQKNAEYAVHAVNELVNDVKLASDLRALWERVIGEAKEHNSQMDVVVALWNAKLITRT